MCVECLWISNSKRKRLTVNGELYELTTNDDVEPQGVLSFHLNADLRWGHDFDCSGRCR